MRRIKVISTAALLVLMFPGWAAGELCPDCKGKSYVASVGKCTVCGGTTASQAFKLCKACSAKLGQCEHCRAKLSAKKIDTDTSATYRSGKWEYQYTITAQGTRSEGRHGVLFHDGRKLTATNVGDYYQTPWGKLYWAGMPMSRWGNHGWMPKPTGKVGKLLTPPKREHGNRVIACVVVGTEQWASKQISSLGLPEDPVGMTVWKELGEKKAMLHASSKAGERVYARITSHKPEKEFRIEVTGKNISPLRQTVVLGDRAGERAMLKLTRRAGGSNVFLGLRVTGKPAGKPQQVLVTESQNGKVVFARGVQEVLIRLKGNPTTGYRWTVAKVQGESIKQVGKVQYTSAPAPKGLVGGGGVFEVRFRIVKPGKTTVTLDYKRPWEKKAAAKTFLVTIDVPREKRPRGRRG